MAPQLTFADPLVRLDRALIYPPLLVAVEQALAACSARGKRYVATFGFRSFEEQSKLYAAHLKGGPKAAPPGLSAHNYGLALDFCPDADPTTPALEPDWRDISYIPLGEAVLRVGLVWGASFNDKPHVQWPGFVSGKQLASLRAEWLRYPELSLSSRLTHIWTSVHP